MFSSRILPGTTREPEGLPFWTPFEPQRTSWTLKSHCKNIPKGCLQKITRSVFSRRATKRASEQICHGSGRALGTDRARIQPQKGPQKLQRFRCCFALLSGQSFKHTRTRRHIHRVIQKTSLSANTTATIIIYGTMTQYTLLCPDTPCMLLFRRGGTREATGIHRPASAGNGVWNFISDSVRLLHLSDARADPPVPSTPVGSYVFWSFFVPNLAPKSQSKTQSENHQHYAENHTQNDPRI